MKKKTKQLRRGKPGLRPGLVVIGEMTDGTTRVGQAVTDDEARDAGLDLDPYGEEVGVTTNAGEPRPILLAPLEGLQPHRIQSGYVHYAYAVCLETGLKFPKKLLGRVQCQPFNYAQPMGKEKPYLRFSRVLLTQYGQPTPDWRPKLWKKAGWAIEECENKTHRVV